MKAKIPSRGYFAIGVEGVSKYVNLGNLLRTAHAFGASFVFIGADPRALETRADTSKAPGHLPLYHWPSLDAVALPKGCSLVGVELLDTATDLPVFAHPVRAAYLLGPERGVLSATMLSRCDHVIRIPTAFSLNLATAGAVVMYDRLRASGRFGTRPVAVGASAEPPPFHVQGAPRKRPAKPEPRLANRQRVLYVGMRSRRGTKRCTEPLEPLA